jgi:hypothetical protein
LGPVNMRLLIPKRVPNVLLCKFWFKVYFTSSSG